MISEIDRRRIQLQFRGIILKRELELAVEAIRAHNGEIAEFNRRVSKIAEEK